ncbi:putative PEP-binding protein [Rhizobium sp. Root1220]|uniref:putative PEP-binding protein n=1 Tax=Rhizobium sp. Root1220 TaxID=1736432 RepID=UPI0006F4CA63|nr:putative PEP-binding protein [Rhizobium sp. Root1220]KQV80028.1 phosphoenolpyruvate protein kinase [Rhizobium sp. Root1220]
MAEPLRLDGTIASPGVATGPAYLVEPTLASVTPRAQASSGYEVLAAAIETAVTELQRLAGGADAESGDIIDFQIEVLRDPTIAQMTAARMETGENVAFAWVDTLDGYIRELETAEEEQMRARAVDILDIKNRVLGALTGTPLEDFPLGSVFVGKDMEPSRFLAHDWSSGGGIALYNGSAAGHVALLARSRSVPMVVGVGYFTTAAGAPIRVDGDAGAVVLQSGARPMPRKTPVGVSGNAAHASGSGTPRTADGVPLSLSINLNDPTELDSVDHAAVAGIGLLRSEFAITSAADAANEERQLSVYCRVLEWAVGKPVTIRMFDIGSDKPLSGFETLPDVGLRGIRLLLARPEIARVQVRALLRASAFGNLAVMLPMVTVPSEIDEMRRIFKEEATELDRRSVLNRFPSIGMMVEVPAAALMLDSFAVADFFSFGTNDLTQYLTASARYGSGFEIPRDKSIPAVLRLIEQAVKLAAGKPVSICGDMAGDPGQLSALLATGLRHFSMAPAQLPAIRSALVGLNADGTKAAGE